MGFNSVIFINNDLADNLLENAGREIYNALQYNQPGRRLTFGSYIGNTHSSGAMLVLIGGNTFTQLPGIYTSDMICSQEATLKALAKSLGYRVVKKKEV